MTPDAASATYSRPRPFWRSPHNLLYVVALIFLAIVLWRSQFWESGDAIDSIKPGYLIAVPLLSLILALPLALRERAILRGLGYRVPARSLVPLSFYGATVGFMTPAASGEVLRPSLFERTFGVPLAKAVGLVLFERSYSMFLFGLSCVLALSWTSELPGWAGPAVLPVLIAACFVPSAVTYVAPFAHSHLPAERLGSLVPRRVRRIVGGRVREGGSTLQTLWSSPRVVVLFVALGACIFTVNAFQFWFIPRGLGQDISFQEAWVVLSASAMAGFLSGLPFGLGATDAVMLSLLKAYGVDTAAAGQIVILTRTLINLPTGLLGLGAYLIALRQQPLAGETGATEPASLVASPLGGKEE